MSETRLTHRQQFNKLLREAEPNSNLRNEILKVQVSMGKPSHQAVTELIELLKASTERKVQHLISDMFATAKDDRVVRVLIKLVQKSDNKDYRCNLLWPLVKYDCTKHLNFFVNLIMEQDGYNEVMWACVEIVRTMKGPFEPSVARRNIRKLFTESKNILDESQKTELAALRLEAADSIMAKYFNHTLKTFWVKWNAGEH